MTYRTLSRRRFLGAAAVGAAASFVTATRTIAAPPEKRYEPVWESLDSHQCPEWFRDAKIGMYFHWGVSSVPGWAPRVGGTPYAEWYWHSMEDERNPTWTYHRATYGGKFAYDDFLPMFRAERYRPEDWIAFAKRAGARYVFINAKHHDGFCLWPSRYTRRTAFRMGPKRDLIGSFVKAARKENLKVGFYYSFYEWYNRDTDPEDCLSAGELIRMLVNGVYRYPNVCNSHVGDPVRNGNFDINVGPTAGVVITGLERQPLEALGVWLEVNGEAIYGARPWTIPAEGDIRFTARGEHVYAIFLKWEGERFRIRSLRAAEGSAVTMLGVPGSLKWRREDEGMSIEFPLHLSRSSQCSYAWAFRVRPT